jgi:3-hydroxyisobutyrate dehydrogenase
MGYGMASNILKAKHSLIVHDLRSSVVDKLVCNGAKAAKDASEVAANSEIVFTSLPGPKEIDEAVRGKNGIGATIQPNSIYIDVSTNSLKLTRELGEHISSLGAHMLDCPVSGGPSGAEKGTLALMVGGDKEVYDRAFDILSVIGEKITYTGSIGSGTLCKLAHNAASIATGIAIAEALSMGVKGGVDAKALWEVMVNGALGNMLDLKVAIPKTLFQDNYEPLFSLQMALKDIKLATSVAKELEVPARLTNMATAELEEAMNRGWGDKDTRIAMKLQEQRANVEIRVSGLDI